MTGRGEATWSVLIGALRAVPIAVGLVHLVVAVIVATVVPQQALLGIVWRVGQRDQGVWVLVPVLAAYVLGSVAAELTRPKPSVPADEAAARLEPRRPRSYLVPWARRLPVVSAALLLVVLVVHRIVGPEAAAGSGTTTPVVLATMAVALLGGAGLQRWVVRRPQQLPDDTARAFDDTARSSTAHAIAGGTSVALLALASELLSDLYNVALDGPRGVMWVLLPFSLAVVAGILGVWGRYGSAHPGRRPGAPLLVDRPPAHGGGGG